MRSNNVCYFIKLFTWGIYVFCRNKLPVQNYSRGEECFLSWQKKTDRSGSIYTEEELEDRKNDNHLPSDYDDELGRTAPSLDDVN